jgi:peptidoglycan/xylan/chitin deacetylase (PgdA/CDA1 family)
MNEPRTVTSHGGPWTRRSEAAQTPRLPRLYQDDPPVEDDTPDHADSMTDGELDDLATAACRDDRALALLMSRPELLRRVLELLARYDAQADWFCALAERQLLTVERLQDAVRHLSVQVAVAVAPRVPEARADFGGDTESYPSDVLRGKEP